MTVIYPTWRLACQLQTFKCTPCKAWLRAQNTTLLPFPFISQIQFHMGRVCPVREVHLLKWSKITLRVYTLRDLHILNVLVSHLYASINSLRTQDLTAPSNLWWLALRTSSIGAWILSQLRGMPLSRTMRYLERNWWERAESTQSTFWLGFRYEGVWRESSALHLPASLLAGGCICSCCLSCCFYLPLTSECSFFCLPPKTCSSSGMLQTSITRLGLLRHLALWVEKVTRLSALPPSSQTIGPLRQNHGSQSNKSLLYSMFIRLAL